MSDPKANILIVDDHHENLLALEAALAGLDENLVQAESGEEALKCLLKQQFAVVLLDVRLPGIDGFETARLMRERDQSKHTPVIFMTAIDKSDDLVSKGYSLGAVDYIFKPAVSEIVRCKVQVFVDLFKLNQQLASSNAELQRSNQDLEHFAYAASHDLKAPLRGIGNVANWIGEEVGDVLPEKSARHLRQMQQRVQRMEHLLDDLLVYSRVGRESLEIVEADTASLVRETVDLLAPPEQFTISVVSEMPVLRTATTPLAQCFRNLIGNAIKHHERESGRVEVSCRDAGALVEFSVADDGPGIAPEFHEHIFQMFQTLRPRDEVEGSGIGLALIKRIVEEFGGSINVESSPAGGTIFRFTWPKQIKEPSDVR